MAICRGIHNFQSHPNMILLQYCWWRSPYNIPTRLSFLWLVLWRFPEIGVPLFIIHFTIGYVPLNHPAIGIPPFMEIPWYKVVPPSYKWVIIPLTSSDISPTNHSEIGLICTNLANYGAPPCIDGVITYLALSEKRLMDGDWMVIGWWMLFSIIGTIYGVFNIRVMGLYIYILYYIDYNPIFGWWNASRSTRQGCSVHRRFGFRTFCVPRRNDSPSVANRVWWVVKEGHSKIT